MRIVPFFALILVLSSCDRSRVYEKNQDFTPRYWLISEKPSFEFTITDQKTSYNIYCNLRNSVEYPYSRIFLTYTLKDSSGVELKKEMFNTFLFDEKTGKPLGSSGLGDIYDQQILLLNDFTFNQEGKYTLQFEQFMRTDTLPGVLAVGARIETATK